MPNQFFSGANLVRTQEKPCIDTDKKTQWTLSCLHILGDFFKGDHNNMKRINNKVIVRALRSREPWMMEHLKSLIFHMDDSSLEKRYHHERRNSISLPIIAWEADPPSPALLPRNSNRRKSFNLLYVLNKNSSKKGYDIFGSLKRRLLNSKRWEKSSWILAFSSFSLFQISLHEAGFNPWPIQTQQN